MPYEHFTYYDRLEVQHGLRQGLSRRAIAEKLGRAPSSISREVQRNRNKNGQYDAMKAQVQCLARQKGACRTHRLEHLPLRDYVKEKLEEDWSPGCISEMLKLEHPEDTRMRVSHETIYQYVYADKRQEGELYTHLRQGRKQRRKRGGGKSNRGSIKNRVSIEERPGIVDAQERIGDWEGDTVIGRNHKRPMATFVERKSLYTTANFMENKRAVSLNDAALSAFAHLPAKALKTITVDNGKEFAKHEQLAQALGVDIYFAHPYSSNERAINENTNGLIRQYVPKGTDFTKVPDQELKKIIEKLNNRPRAKLAFRTPKEVLETFTGALQV